MRGEAGRWINEGAGSEKMGVEIERGLVIGDRGGLQGAEAGDCG